MESTGDRLGRREEAKGGQHLWDWIESKMIDTLPLHRRVRTHNTQQLTHNCNQEGLCGLSSGGCAPGVWKKQSSLTFQRCVSTEANRQLTGSAQVKDDFCRGRF